MAHPIPDSPPWTDKERIRNLEVHLAMAWDQLWWLSLPFWRRWCYLLQGFRAPLPVSMFRERSAFYD